MAIRIVNHVPMVEEHLRDSGFSQVPWGRRGRTLSTHAQLATIVTVRGVDGSMRPVDHTYVDGFFEELAEQIATLGDRPVALVFEGGGSVRVPDWFNDWCDAHGITILVVDENNVEGLAERLVKGVIRKPTVEDRIAELERALGGAPFPMYRGDGNGPKWKPEETEAEHWLRRLEDWLCVKRSNPSLWNKMARGD